MHTLDCCLGKSVLFSVLRNFRMGFSRYILRLLWIFIEFVSIDSSEPHTHTHSHTHIEHKHGSEIHARTCNPCCSDDPGIRVLFFYFYRVQWRRHQPRPEQRKHYEFSEALMCVRLSVYVAYIRCDHDNPPFQCLASQANVWCSWCARNLNKKTETYFFVDDFMKLNDFVCHKLRLRERNSRCE